eukprot:tig00001038_g6525.t1
MRRGALVLVALVAFLALASAFEANKFRKCGDTGFCKRQRSFNKAGDPSKWSVLPESIAGDGSSVVGVLVHSEQAENKLQFELTPYRDATFRLRVREVNPARPRFEVPVVVQEEDLKASVAQYAKTAEAGATVVTAGTSSVKIEHSPFRLTVSGPKGPAIVMNARNLFNWERARNSPDDGSSGLESAGSESFGSHTDKKPFGPASMGTDFTFLGAKHVYGIPERATSMALKPTRGEGVSESTEPYRLYTLDIFEYELENNIGLYGAVPLMLGHDAEKTSAVFWLNAGEMFVDVLQQPAEKCLLGALFCRGQAGPGPESHWMAESGAMDLFFMMGPSFGDVQRQYTAVTGRPAMPQYFATAYHQCRWNYNNEEDVKAVDAGFDENDIPYDVLWLDIEHTDGKKYMTWDATKFPNPAAMQEDLASRGRKMVTIIDPHIKRDSGYHIHSEATSKGYYIKTAEGSDYEGWCWPGSVSYLDFLSPEVRGWYADKHAYDQYKGSTKTLYTWNDMNEPTQFNGPELQTAKDAVHAGGVEHRDVHNMYGFLQNAATFEGHLRRSGRQDRPFVLSRSFFAGSQKYGAVWTGDNQAKFEHLEAASPMLLALSLSGIVFSGADVGGFFYNPGPELMVRWYQAGAFTPFFRGHAHIDTKRREPWLFGEPYTSHIRAAIQARYALLPYWYTLFRAAHVTGMPPMRPLWAEYPADAATFAMDDQWLVGRDILVKPAVKEGQTSVSVYLPGDQPWYDYWKGSAVAGGQTVTVQAPLDVVPVFQRGGSVVPRRERQRRSSAASHADPYTLLVALDSAGRAEGELYVDDGRSYAYQRGGFIHRAFSFADKALTSKAAGAEIPLPARTETFAPGTVVERVVVLGWPAAPRAASIAVAGGAPHPVEFEYDAAARRLTLRQPAAPVDADWTLSIQ